MAVEASGGEVIGFRLLEEEEEAGRDVAETETPAKAAKLRRKAAG